MEAHQVLCEEGHRRGVRRDSRDPGNLRRDRGNHRGRAPGQGPREEIRGHPCGRLDGDGDQLHLERAGSRPGSGQGLDRDLHGRAHPGARPQEPVRLLRGADCRQRGADQELQGADPQAPQRDRRIQHRGPPAGPVRADQRAARRAFQLDPPDRLLRQRPGIHPPATQGAAQGDRHGAADRAEPGTAGPAPAAQPEAPGTRRHDAHLHRRRAAGEGPGRLDPSPGEGSPGRRRHRAEFRGPRAEHPDHSPGTGPAGRDQQQRGPAHPARGAGKAARRTRGATARSAGHRADPGAPAARAERHRAQLRAVRRQPGEIADRP
ncbi:Uncharacterised protein [Pseudomonas aeruginosa]|nr:Uncharacterised protein [Pseudomonas aeruginosa]